MASGDRAGVRLSNVEESVIIPKAGSESIVAATCHDREPLKTTAPLLHSQKPAISPATTARSATIDLIMQLDSIASFIRRGAITPHYRGQMRTACALQ